VTNSDDAQGKIALARRSLTTKLAELRKREAHVRAMISPIRHLANPWLRLGLAAFVGYRLGRRGPSASTSTSTSIELAPRQGGLVQGLIRTGASALTTVLVRHLAEQIVAKLAPERATGDQAG
jgi:hypothetical protein